MMKTEITDETRISCINALATVLSETYGSVEDTETLSKLLSDIVGKPMKQVDFFNPKGQILNSRKVPNILCGSSKCKIKLTRENGLSATIKFPSTVGDIDATLLALGKAQTDDEKKLATFESDLMDTLDAYGHLAWTVGNEDWIACADASLGRFEGKLYLAWHVVVDCDSGGFTDTIESGFTEIGPDSNPPLGILNPMIDVCLGRYIHEQNESHLHVDIEECSASASEFDEHVRKLWGGNDGNLDLDFDEENEEPSDPMSMGWVDQYGRP